MSDSRDSKSGVGFLLGLIIGAVGGIFLAPKSGKENREVASKKLNEMKDMIQNGEVKENIEKIFGNLSDESVKMYNNVHDEVLERVEEMKTMNADDYAAMVQDVIEKVKEGSRIGAEQLKKLKDQFIKDYPEVKEEVEKKTKKVKSEKEKLLADKK
jgi:gas vesicle protein